MGTTHHSLMLNPILRFPPFTNGISKSTSAYHVYYDSINTEHQIQRGIFGSFDYVYWSSGGEKEVAGLFEKYGGEYDTEDEITVVSNTKSQKRSNYRLQKMEKIKESLMIYRVGISLLFFGSNVSIKKVEVKRILSDTQ